MSKLSILVVDDEPNQRDTLAEILTEHGYTVTTAEDAPAAKGLIAAQPFAIIMTHFKMRGGSGLDVAKAAVKYCEGSAIVSMTEYADVSRVIDAMQIGVTDYLLK